MTGLAVTCLTHLSVQPDCVKKKRTCSWGFRVRCWAKVTVCLWSPWWISCVFAYNGLVSVVSVGGNREATVKAQEFSFAEEKWCRRKQRGHTNLWETGQRRRKTDLNSLLFYGWWTSTWPSGLHHRATLSGYNTADNEPQLHKQLLFKNPVDKSNTLSLERKISRYNFLKIWSNNWSIKQIKIHTNNSVFISLLL